MFESVFSGGVIKKALEKGLVEIHVHDLRDFAHGKHRQVDDRPYGGGLGMVLKPEPVFRAVEKVKCKHEASIVLLSPQGRKFDFHMAQRLAKLHQLILICGRYEGLDERVVQCLATEEVSIGDYILTGGETAAMVVIDAVARLVPDVVGKANSVKYDSFYEGMLDFPQYTRPRQFKGMKVPEILFSGDHKKIGHWRRKKALEKTWLIRPDILKKRNLSPEDKKILDEIRTEKEGKKNESD